MHLKGGYQDNQELPQITPGVSSWCNSSSAGLRNRNKRVRTPAALLRSPSDKYSQERHEPPYPPSYELNSARGVMVIVVENGHDDTSSNPGRD